MKAVLTNRIYMTADMLLQNKLEEELTYIFPRFNPTNPPEVFKNIAMVRSSIVSIPVGRLDLIPENYLIVDKRTEVPVEFPEFNGTLRASQKAIYDQVDSSCIINAKPAWGKTFSGLAIAAKLGQKTLVAVHTVPLRNQWAREVKKVFGIEPGIIGSGMFETDSPIVIGNVQALYRKSDEIKKMFGTIIMDEVHHVSAPTFSRIIDVSYAKYKIGLSATLQRKDGKHIMFSDYFGKKVFTAKKENSMTAEIHIIKSQVRFPDGARTPWAIRINQLMNDQMYRNTVCATAMTYAHMGHKVLVVADRVNFLKACQELVGDQSVVVVGETDNREREIAKLSEKPYNILFGTQSIFSEGINQTHLSCLILATPINNNPLLEQLIGRIERMMEGKRTPVVIDYHLVGNTARRQASQRMNFYIQQGYKIKQVA